MKKIRKNDKVIAKMIADPRYHITPKGRIWTCVSAQGHVTDIWRTKTQTPTVEGYLRTGYHGQWLAVHRIVYAKYYGNLQSDMQVNHINGLRWDNRIENLEQIYPSENMNHSYQILKRPVNYGARSLTAHEVQRIRDLHAQGKPYSKLMKQFKVAKSTISYVINKKTYKAAT